MKLTKSQKRRLAELRAKSADSRTAAEQKELDALLTAAKSDESIKLDDDLEKCEFQKAFNDGEFAAAQQDGDNSDDDNEGSEDGKALDDEQLDALLQKSVGTVLKQHGIVDTSDILKELKGRKSLTAEEVEQAVEKHFKDSKIDPKEVAAAVKAALPRTFTAEDLDEKLGKAFDKLAEVITQKSKNEFEMFAGVQNGAPIEHRSGNLSVGEKQLLNLCLGGVSEDAIKSGKSVRPKGIDDGITADQLARAAAVGAEQIKSVRNSIIFGGKAITTGSSGNGAELIPSDLSSQLQSRMYLESQLAQAMVQSEIVMPTNTFKFPLKTTRTTFYKGSENPGSDPTSSNPGTSEITLDAQKLIGMAEYSYEAEEDAIIPILPMLQEDLATGAADALENAIINGDTAATQDSDASAGDDTTLFDGLRKLCLAGGSPSSTGSLTYNTAGLMGLRASMLRWGIRPADLFLLVGVSGYNKLLALTETLTVDKYGPNATIQNGLLGQFAGVPIVISHRVREDLNTAAVYDSSNADSGSVFFVHRPSWLMGVKRGFTVEVEVDRKRQMNAIIASFRRDFVPKETVSATMPIAHMGYGWAS